MKLFNHYKNKPYKFHGIAKHSETLEELVVYECLYDNPTAKLWVRPKDMFFGEVTVNGKSVPRFAEVPIAVATTSKTDSSIREMRETDLPKVRYLAEQLGYPVSFDHVSRRFQTLEGKHDHMLFVACNDDGEVVGWIHVGREMSSLLTNERADIGALVVDSQCRGQGVGSKLLKAAEEWAVSQQLELVRVRSNVKRSDAHRFYERQGYSLIKSWHLFTKGLS